VVDERSRGHEVQDKASEIDVSTLDGERLVTYLKLSLTGNVASFRRRLLSSARFVVYTFGMRLITEFFVTSQKAEGLRQEFVAKELQQILEEEPEVRVILSPRLYSEFDSNYFRLFIQRVYVYLYQLFEIYVADCLTTLYWFFPQFLLDKNSRLIGPVNFEDIFAT